MFLPRYYEFGSPAKTVAGHNVLEKIPEMLETLNGKKPMILTDKGVTGAGLIDLVKKAIEKKITIGTIEDDVPPDSDVKVVNKLSKIYKKTGCDSIIAVGGGSVLDTAKGINILVSEDSDDLMKFTGANILKRRLKPMIAIPTTSGTGSEVTIAAVIADHEKNTKLLFASYFLLPDIAILDSRMTLTLPPFLTALTGMDALTHAMEAYYCLAKNPISDSCALEAISLISNNLLNVVKNPDDAEGRLALATGAHLAGASFSNSTCGMVHGLGHSVGGVCHAPHGTCMSIFLPYGLEYNLHKVEDYIGELLFPLAGDKVYAETPKEKRAEKTIEFIRNLNQQLHDATDGKHARSLKEIVDRDGKMMVPENRLEEIARTTMGDGTLFYNPEELDYNDAMMVLEAAWEGKKLNK